MNELSAIQDQIPDAIKAKLQSMTPLNQSAFVAEFNRKRKSTLLAFVLLWILGLHYAYLGKWWMTLIFWITFGGLFIWWFIDLFRVFGMVRDYNKTVAFNVLKDIQALA